MSPERDPYIIWFERLDLSRIENIELRNECIRTWAPFRSEVQDYAPEIEYELAPDVPVPETDPYPSLAQKRAEDEEETLFISKNAFWPGHPTYQEFLRFSDRNQIIYGEFGSGLTALAKGIWANESRWTPYFWFYVPINSSTSPTLNSINTLLSEQLLNYILTKPLRLVILGPHQRELLANVLTFAFSKNYVCAKIERAVLKRLWLEHAAEAQREKWQYVGETQLALLTGDICKLDSLKYTSFQWLNTLTEVFQALGFEQIRLMLDFGPDTEDVAKKMIFILAGWDRRNVVSTFFLPISVQKKAKLTENQIPQIELVWNADQLDELVRHRYYRIAQQRHAWRFIGGTQEKYQDFLNQLSKPLTPRGLIEKLHGKESPEKPEAKDCMSDNQGINHERNRFFDWALTRFDKEGLEEICFRLSIDKGRLRQDTTPQFLISLIDFCEQNKRLEDLLNLCKGMRPANWPDFESWIEANDSH